MLPTPDPARPDAQPIAPYRRLMAAVLQAVVDDCRSGGQSTPVGIRDVRKANAYVTSTDRTWPFSFENLCDALGLSAGLVRKALRDAPGTVLLPLLSAAHAVPD